MAVDDIVGIRIVGRYQDQNIVNTIHFQITAQSSSELDILQSLTDQWLVQNGSTWRGRHIDTYRLVGIKGFSLSGPNKIPGITEDGTVGDVIGTEVPALVCRTITMYTASSNFRRRGRVMLSGGEIAQFETGDGSVTAAERALMGTLGALLINDVVAGGDSFTPGLAPTDVLPFEPFTGQLGRKTPSSVTSRRIRGFSIG